MCLTSCCGGCSIAQGAICFSIVTFVTNLAMLVLAILTLNPLKSYKWYWGEYDAQIMRKFGIVLPSVMIFASTFILVVLWFRSESLAMLAFVIYFATTVVQIVHFVLTTVYWSENFVVSDVYFGSTCASMTINIVVAVYVIPILNSLDGIYSIDEDINKGRTGWEKGSLKDIF